ncbi:SDR family NAD(P)-dependent oxidoreductase [Phenylobacterium sp.]|jgi:NAD(P)-dependent dehydrogenase (short-subunit alcohol dehydrogenase family)|uniref:SDR family NAD(P)-dependent oxidoreductase n=1 Tax=Phenylobacterium sp. TaxID=1871053 RepID=UPI002E3377D4|nr:SDR family NAD(P)-dependent oxidoreductase [Phenylobacterium sp.]HEX2560885.1 SDR family NAD(P)-dependent oxidoreductase [Phenylobacterium sp.]
MDRLQGRSTVVTGAASGIGRASAILFAQEGAAVVCVDRAEAVADTVKQITDAGGRAVAMTGDVSDETFVESFIARAVSDFGGLDACYANAGIGSAGQAGFTELTAEHWMTVLKVNLIGPFLAIKHASKVMIPAGKGSIICTASVAGIRSGAGGVPYSASKAGVINLVQTTANEFYGTGVRVNAICPGLIETGMTRGVYEYARAKGTADRIGQLNPLARGGEPSEIAHAALFLASDDSSYVNGQAIVVDGGLSSSHPVARRGKR